MHKILLFYIFIILPFLGETSSNSDKFNVLNYGAIGDGRSDDTKAFMEAWEATCKSSSPSSTMEVPSGHTFLINPLNFYGPCNNKTINVQMNGDIVAPSDEPSEWRCENNACNNWMHFRYVNNLNINGNSVINGRGTKWWRNIKNHDLSPSPVALHITSSDNVTLSGLSFKDNPHIHLLLHYSTSVHVSNITIDNPGDSPYTDGIKLSGCTNVTIDHVRIATGDDCISILKGTSDLRISNVTCGPGHGISIGSLGGDGGYAVVENIHVSDVVFIKSMNGARIKTWQGGSGHVKDIVFERILSHESDRIINVDQFYCDGIHCDTQPSALQISNITFRQVLGTSSRHSAVTLTCSKTVPCKDITVEDIYILSSGHKREAPIVCENAHGKAQGMKVPIMYCLDQV